MLRAMDWYSFWQFVHIVGVIVFVAAHGISAAVTIRITRERDPERLQALLDFSSSALVLAHGALVVLILGGVANWFRVDYSPEGWLWASVGLLIVLAVGGVVLTRPYFQSVRSAVAARDEGALEILLRSPRPWVAFWLGTAGTLAIAWLMVYKPF